MNAWLLATVGVLPPLAVVTIAACRGRIAERLVAAQLATPLATIALVLMSFAFDQTSLVDLALTLALLTAPGTLVIALFVERWV